MEDSRKDQSLIIEFANQFQATMIQKHLPQRSTTLGHLYAERCNNAYSTVVADNLKGSLSEILKNIRVSSCCFSIDHNCLILIDTTFKEVLNFSYQLFFVIRPGLHHSRILA